MSLSLERRAALWGDRTAVVDVTDDQRVSYAELDEQAESAARRLAALGVEAGDAVAVVSRNRIEVLALLFAARRLGAIFAPISHRLTPATVEGPLDTISPAVVVHEAAQRDLVREVPDERIHSFEEFARLETESYERPNSNSGTSLYLHPDPTRKTRTDSRSGPRRAPPVVDVPTRAAEWNCVTVGAAWGLGRADCAPALLPLSDPDGLLRTALPLLYAGGRVVLLRAFDPSDALETIQHEGVTFCLAGATEYRELVADETFERTDFDGLDWAATRTGLPTDVREAVARRVPVVRIYASAETGANCYVPPERADRAMDPDYVGRPFPDCELRVVRESEEDAERTADGEVGDLEVRGPVVAAGYVEDGEPFPEWVATGDVAYREDGDYCVLGSSSEEVRAGSERVHPRLVERTLERHEGVTAAGVVGGGAGGTDDELRAMVVGSADAADVRGFARERLPNGAVPREITTVESLPRRPTGEVNRAKLRRQLDG
ncbi:class I adenylate-forming enzyme family protein [Halorussus halophilus]|uniref:class I adenylate-forming enzyme family protein n=1 Tax=Halorussus halophilus TaxID=2650975 RepID=UPI0013019235|nr:AMP-binding protein [Halorussus halophilus]